jgi:hypothetical protein
MSFTFNKIERIFSDDEIEYIYSLREVQEAKLKLQNDFKVDFSIEAVDLIKNKLINIGINIGNEISMRWIIGDTHYHIDNCSTEFKNTYLVYLNDCPGEFIIGDQTYGITKNTCFIFNSGTAHRLLKTENIPRLIVGPMNEMGNFVGN